MVHFDGFFMSTRSKIPLLLAASLFAACGVANEPDMPLGSEFPAHAVINPYSDSATGSTGDGTPQPGSITAGFRVTVGSQELSVGEQNAQAVASNIGIPYTTLTAAALDGTGKNYTFTLTFQSAAKQYPLIGYQQWLQNPDFNKAGFQYVEEVSGSGGVTSSAASGILDILQYQHGRVIGRLTGQLTVSGEEVPIVAEFNVPVQQQ
jgi:hypothetical protein